MEMVESGMSERISIVPAHVVFSNESAIKTMKRNISRFLKAAGHDGLADDLQGFISDLYSLNTFNDDLHEAADNLNTEKIYPTHLFDDLHDNMQDDQTGDIEIKSRFMTPSQTEVIVSNIMSACNYCDYSDSLNVLRAVMGEYRYLFENSELVLSVLGFGIPPAFDTLLTNPVYSAE